MFSGALPSLVSVTVTGVLVALERLIPKVDLLGIQRHGRASWGLILVRKALLLALTPW